MIWIYYAIAGIIIGFIARAVVPGRQNLNILWTGALGLAGMMIGAVVGTVIPPDNSGVPWILGIICAIGLLIVLERTNLLARFTSS